MIIFLLIFIASFIVALRDVLMGNRAGVLVFMIFGLSIYSTAMSVAYMYGLKSIIPVFQYLKEILIITTLILSIVNLKQRPRFHLVDYLILGYLGYMALYAILPLGESGFVTRLLSLKSMSFFIVVYFAGRLVDPKTLQVSKYFNFLVILTIAAGALVLAEGLLGWQLQSSTGYADYNYYFFNQEPSGETGLGTTFDSEGGYARYGSFFFNPLELAGATILALSVMAGLYTRDDNKFSFDSMGVIGIIASLACIILALSRAPLASYCFVVYVYALITKRKAFTRTIHAALGLVALYVIYLFVRFENTTSGIMAVVMSTIDFSNPSSVGHIEQWAEGIVAIQQHPLGMGLGSSGRVAATVSENVGGENQFIIIGVQAGLIAVGLYLSIFVMFIKTSLKWLPYLKGRERKLCMAVLLMKVGFFIPLLTSEVESSSYISYMNWFFSGLLVAVIMQPRTQQELSDTEAIEPAYA